MQNRLAHNTVAVREIHRWFRQALRNGVPFPSEPALEALAQKFKVLLHRANNAEEKRQKGFVENPKDVSPDAHQQELIDAIVNATNAYRDHVGDILPTPNGEVDLQEFNDRLAEQAFWVSSINPAARKVVRLGPPPMPWKDAAREFARLVREVLVQSGYRGALSLATVSAPIVITAQAISWAYKAPLTPEGLLSALRNRDRRKKKP